jgi:hypothetical protein
MDSLRQDHRIFWEGDHEGPGTQLLPIRHRRVASCTIERSVHVIVPTPENASRESPGVRVRARCIDFLTNRRPRNGFTFFQVGSTPIRDSGISQLSPSDF